MGDLDVTISPDGQRIAYWALKPESGNIELYVRDLDALEARAIPGTEHSPSGAPRNLFFSADGNSVGYATPSRSVVSVAIDGRPPVELLDRVARANFLGGWWSADNSLIFSTGQRLERVSTAGRGTPEPLMAEMQDGIIAAPVLLPGGRAVLFRGSPDRVAVLDLTTRQVKTVIERGSNPAYLDTGHVLFVRGGTLMAVPFDAQELDVTGEPVALMEGIRRAAGAAADYALSANGTLVYVPASAQVGARAAVVWVDRAGQVTGRAVPETVVNPRDPRLSPDGERLLLVTGSDSDGDLWSYDLRGRPPIPLALPSNNMLPAWSPDGRQVAFLAYGGGGLMSLAADGSERAPRILRAGDLAPVAWSTAGELILWRVGGDLLATPATPQGELRDVVSSDANENDAALSRDGRWLAYRSDRTGQDEIWVQGYPDGVAQRVSRNGGHEPLWSADGRELFYLLGNSVMAVDVTTTGNEFSFSAPRTLFSGPYRQDTSAGTRTYDIADGRLLMILPAEVNDAALPASIVVVQNFGEELKQRVRPSGQ
jgi:Tol biopolymer transport system component